MIDFGHGETCYRVFPPTELYPNGDVIRLIYHDGLAQANYLGLLFKDKQEAETMRRKKIKSYNSQLTENERLLFQALKETIEDLELRAQVHKTLTGEEMVVPMSDSRYRKAKDVIAKFERVSK